MPSGRTVDFSGGAARMRIFEAEPVWTLPRQPNWYVFDAEGRSLGAVAFPDGMTPMRFVGSHVYGLLRDEFDVPHVVRVRLDW
jgi:hypothetical protein